jgi:hypothetical protein
MRGVSMIAGGFNSEGQMYQWLIYGYTLQQPKNFYYYFSFFVMLYVIGQYSQRSAFRKEKLKQHDSYLKP